MATLNNVEIFRSGTHTDSAGRTRTWTLDDLKKIVSQYDPANEEVPAVIGHPKETAPAYGWLKRIWLKGESIIGDFHQVADELVAAIKAGRYKKRSVSLDRDMRLQHVGFLGAALPGVSGLKDIEFSAEAEMDTYEFTSTSEGITPEEDYMDLATALAEIEKLKDALKVSTDEVKALKDEGKDNDFAAKIKAAEDKAKVATDALAAFNKKQAEDKLTSRVDALVKDGKVLPADKDKELNFAKAMSDGEATMDFSKGDGQTEKVSPQEAYLRNLEARDPNELLNEFAQNGGGSNETVIDTSEITSKI